MKIWWKLAWIEWWRSIQFWNKGNKDFFWLTLLLALTLSLALLVYGTREGLLNRFMDVSLGYVQDAGIPIWVIAKVDDQGRVLDRELLEKIKASKYNIHPYRLIEWDKISLPATLDGKTELWQAKHIPFKGWAVQAHDPLWKNNLSKTKITSELPLEIIASKALFEKYFQCKKYETILKNKLPNFKTSQVTNDNLYCLANQSLWLEVNTIRGRELMPFHINWVTGRIVTMDELAFLFPISTLYALDEAKYSPQLKYYPEGQGDKVKRVKALIFWQNEENEDLRANLANCLLAKPVENKATNQIIPKYPLPLKWVEQCAKRYAIPLQIEPSQLLPEPYLSVAESLDGHRFRYYDDKLTILCDYPCSPVTNVVPAWKKYAIQSNDSEATADMLTMIGGYQQAFVYTERNGLFERLTELKTITRTPKDPPALSIHPTYDNALIRFNFIDDIMQLLNSSYGLFFIVFLIVLLVVQIGIVIQHRQHGYGIFLAKGMSWIQLHFMVYMQIVLSFLLALILTMLSIIMMQKLLGVELSFITKRYETNIQVGDLELLPLLWVEYGIVSATVLGMAFLIAMLFLLIKQIRFGQQAAHLF
ncbi:MAG: hypothetical protein KAH84_11030 [Thiomargarita sp.]|nr:hypothetical protein [Thiomargarita sp.]